MAQEQEQDRSEAPTPFKLRRARERGQVARSVEVGFLGSLAGFAVFVALSGNRLITGMTHIMSLSLSAGLSHVDDPEAARGLIGTLYWQLLQPLLLLGGTVLVVVIFLELIQLRGFVLSFDPLKPDLSRLNPARGLKRLFSARLLKETLKSLLKAAVYGGATYLLIRASLAHYALAVLEPDQIPKAMRAAGVRLAMMFLLIAIGFVAIDQVLVRQTFLKQMRMSRREVSREARDREGDARIKRKRKQLHAEVIQQHKGMGSLPGSDLLIVNPDHFAVALSYDQRSMAAPTVTVKGRNRVAIEVRARAFRLGIPIIRQPPLARALFKDCPIGKQVPPRHYGAVADLYFEIYAKRQAQAGG
jgi:flagellar biosynthetic protein FlhB